MILDFKKKQIEKIQSRQKKVNTMSNKKILYISSLEFVKYKEDDFIYGNYSSNNNLSSIRINISEMDSDKKYYSYLHFRPNKIMEDLPIFSDSLEAILTMIDKFWNELTWDLADQEFDQEFLNIVKDKDLCLSDYVCWETDSEIEILVDRKKLSGALGILTAEVNSGLNFKIDEEQENPDNYKNAKRSVRGNLQLKKEE